MRLRVVLASALLPMVALGAPAAGSIARSGTRPRQPSTLAVVKERTLATDTGTTNYAFADGKLAWFPYRRPCRTPVHFLNLATGDRGALGRCDEFDPRELAIAGDAIYWLTQSGSNTELDTKVYSAAAGRTRLVASYVDPRCDEDPTCGADLFAAGGHAFVSHAGTVFRVVGSRLAPVFTSRGSRFDVAAWPYVALWHTTRHAETPFGTPPDTTDVRVFRLTDGKHVRTFHDACFSVHLSRSLLATCRSGRARIYDLHSGRKLSVIHGAAVIAVVGRQVVTLQPDSRVLVRSIGGPPRLLIAKIGDDVSQTFVHGRALSWIEGQSPYRVNDEGYDTSGFRLRSLHIEPP